MAKHSSESTLPQSSVFPQQKQKVENADADYASAAVLGAAIDQRRRCKARTDYRRLCSYEVLEAIEEESVVIEQGETVVLNRSAEGILLFMRQAPHSKQLIEVHTSRSGWGKTINVSMTRGLGLFRWSRSEIYAWLAVDGFLAPVTICRFSRLHGSSMCLLQSSMFVRAIRGRG